ncbi:N-acylneuraminate cytidylyltransferase/CMP-N,N'-diacetyllegionaminic acid synthase [Flavobacterium segetis]|uniref:N-acylneuraminate cytidylyltransferase/CMP-N,N'-diacetyllegionaminic acid synthase n=1 Tax=Flavobacterium segetis TaxID=271157 RepID=A0A1M5IFY5_9FLAO|nr:acylneuraminate cytidylyltransferase family protein [Flavobacterium segetis]SHG27202.1 N-acylneuraminate cytidylyltransferase/CMP-N,N'-diacetyllegionaminic acid synthase [Flavobacterium segetis]
MKKVLWLITARSGSKSIPDKNIKILGNQPLISYRIQTARNTQISSDIWVSTDSEKYAQIAKEYGAEIPFLRPDYLATDEASSVNVVLHAMDYAFSLDKKYDFIGLLEPTSPFVKSLDLEKAIDLLDKNENASSIVATRESRPNRIFIQKEDDYLSELADNLKLYTKLGRQSFGKEITPSGGFYISKWDDFIKTKSFYTEKTLSYLLDDISGLEIDEPLDWQFAEFIINNIVSK